MTLVWASGYNGVTVPDPDATAYLRNVEVADNQAIELSVATAINDFVVGCKTDGIWDAIKASCILAGARTLSGALVPLKGTAPTNNNFVSGDYDRETGLKGNGSNKYLNANTPNSTAALNNAHVSVYASQLQTTDAVRFYLGASETDNTTILGSDLATPNSSIWVINDTGSLVPRFADSGTGFKGLARNNSANFIRRTNGSSTTVARNATTTAPGSSSFNVFARNGNFMSNARLSFYSIGESLDLALLDNRVSTLMTDIGAAIP